jgi:very-short-patch-repair endonuclease
MSLPEVLVWKQIKGRREDGLHFRRQHPLGMYVLDFYCDEAKLAIEIEGQSHSMGGQPGRDLRRDQWLRTRGVETLRLTAEYVLSSLDDAVRMIVHLALEHRRASPSVAARKLAAPPPPVGEDLQDRRWRKATRDEPHPSRK